ncbi:substrate-binding periplasmic protein [Marinomonas fungiae]|uniref:ABC-type amino acid transport/signal transduction system, periplasmic component/domain n=1 Tax=Marinomonas fungiae TaxID=1137284 RepID=A0A0K6ILS6_9GAMM|nr:transporter substrate-binding domain-containing protein [Marinomonas fungiae]CUB04262.1 ABC-type amino acid transport/signal transduction system, periplasmic component/domain [Marinomonas fungiae]
MPTKNEQTKQVLKALTFSALCISFITLFATPVLSDTLRIATDEWCPYDCIPSQNQGKVGYLGDLLIETLKAKGHTVEFVEVSYSRGLQLVREGKLDGTMACYREEAPDFVYPDFALGKSNTTFFSLKGSNWRYTGKKSLEQAKLIGVIKGYDYVDPTVMAYLNQNPKNVLAITGEKPLERLLEMLINGRLTAVIEDKIVLQYKAQQMGKANQIIVSGTTDVTIGVYTSFSPKNPKSAEYAKIVSEETLKMREDGRLQKLLERYGIQDWKAE